jgi:hypothetical protein
MDRTFLDCEVPASLIVDEFQNFVGTSFVTLIPEARKFKLGITVANQTLSQLASFSPHEGLRNDGLSQIILGNVGNLIIQSVGRHDAERIAVEVGMSASDLSRIGKYTALVQLTVSGERLDPFTVRLSASSERPGAVAEAVAVAQAAEALARLGREVEIPQMNRPRRALTPTTGGSVVRSPPLPSPPLPSRPTPDPQHNKKGGRLTFRERKDR